MPTASLPQGSISLSVDNICHFILKKNIVSTTWL